MILPVRLYIEAILNTPCKPVMDFNDPELETLVQNMIETCIAYNGVGLAAPQIGIDKQIAVLHLENRTKIMVVVNPKVTEYSKKKNVQAEGCLSCPGLTVHMKRPESVVAEVNLPNGQLAKYKFDGFDARIFWHEWAHLRGQTIANTLKNYALVI